MDSPATLREQKRLLRRYYRDLRLSLEASQKAELDHALISHILRHPLYEQADAILLYFPVKGEPDLRPIAEDAWCRGKKVAFPISHEEDRRLSFHAIDRLTQLKEGTYGIPEPPSSGMLVNGSSSTLCLVPGLAFDRRGYRLGYGGGYYDRFLADFRGVTVAPVYRLLLADALPQNDTDLPVAHIITEKGEEFLHVQTNKD